MGFPFPGGVSSKGSQYFKTLFLLLLIWISGLFLGSYYQSFSSALLQSHLIPQSWKSAEYKDSNMNVTASINATHSKRAPVPRRASNVSISASVSSSNVKTTSKLKTQNSNTSCNFPVLDPWDSNIKQYVKKYTTLKCSDGMPSFIYVEENLLKVNLAKVKSKLGGKILDGCKYRSLSMAPNSDYVVKYSVWSAKFASSIRFNESDEHMEVQCYQNKIVVAMSFISLIKKKQVTEKIRQESYKQHLKRNAPKETLSVLLVGIDGTSKQNFIRSMPLTKEFIMKQLNALEFHKFNKIGLNTFPNVCGLLAGRLDNNLDGWNRKMSFDKFDHLFLWKHFQDAGYRTAVSLDMTRITAFHYLKKGWSNPKFDYYHRPVIVASEGKKGYRSNSQNCMGDIPEVNFLLDYWLQLTSTFNNTPTTPYFAYSFFARLTHDNQNKASSGDEHYRNFFQELVRRRVLNNTLLIFFSDHGERFGSIRNTYNGMIEAKTPFLFFMFPPWFERKYPELMKNVRTNQHRLMTMFDVHATLKDILNFTGKFHGRNTSARAVSLFNEIPTNRTCETADVPLRFCACTDISHKNVSANFSATLVEYLVKKIVGITDKKRKLCEVLKLKAVKYALLVTPEIPYSNKKVTFYQVTIETTPGDAVYEATMSYNSLSKQVNMVGVPTRLNMYRGQAECVDDVMLRPFCFCSRKSSRRRRHIE